MDPDILTPLAFVASTTQAFGGMIAFSGPALFAATWFPLKERANITAIATFFNYFGVTISFIIGPLLVPGPAYGTAPPDASWSPGGQPNSTLGNPNYITNMDDMKTGIQHLLYVQVSLAALVLLMTIVYFPAKPPMPPSITASLPKANYKDAYRALLLNGQLWIVMIIGAVPRAFVGTWVVIFDIVVKPLGVSQIDAGWISFWHTLVGSLAGIVIAKVPALINNRRKSVITITSIAASAFCIWVAVLCDSFVSFNKESLYASCILLGLTVHGLMPLFYELAAETAYPVGEGFAGSFFTIGVTVFQFIYFGVLSIPGIGVSWLTWTCVGSLVLSVPLIVLFNERNKRYDIDIKL